MLMSFFTVFVLGLRHGADPDHLAIIDNLTRGSYERHPRWSRFVGMFFAGGHALMVTAIALLIGCLGTQLKGSRQWIESTGGAFSLLILLCVSVLNIVQLLNNGDVVGVKARFIPRLLGAHTHALIALPAGLLFGLGFETSSQLAAYSAAFTLGASVGKALIVGLAFCLGIICTDTLDGLLVHRCLAKSPSDMLRAKRLWLGVVTVFALVVALYQSAALMGLPLPCGELTLSACMMAVLLCVYLAIHRSFA